MLWLILCSHLPRWDAGPVKQTVLRHPTPAGHMTEGPASPVSLSTHLCQLATVSVTLAPPGLDPAPDLQIVSIAIVDVDGVDQSPEEDGETQHQTGEHWTHDRDEEINEESDEGPADEDDCGEDDDEHVGDQPGQPQAGLMRLRSKIKHYGEDAVKEGQEDEDGVHQR